MNFNVPRSIIGTQPLKLDQMKVGMEVWLTQENAELFSIPIRLSLDPSYNLPAGRHTIEKIQPVPPGTPAINNTRKAQPHKWVHINPDSWSQDQTFTLVYNVDSEVLCAGSVLIEDALLPIATEAKTVADFNDSRQDCAFCGRQLSILGLTIRICRPCEEYLEKGIVP
jgi:hypothetical protein